MTTPASTRAGARDDTAAPPRPRITLGLLSLAQLPPKMTNGE